MQSASFTRLAQTLGINSVPIAGVFLGDWSTATTLVVYWSETLLAAVSTAGRIAVHRRLTHKKGHYRDQWEKSPSGEVAHRIPRRRCRIFLSGFLTGSLIFTVGLGLFLALLLATVLPGTIDVAAIKRGVFWMAVAQAAAFGWDLLTIRERPFAWVRDAANDVMGRVVLIHLGMLLGMFVLAWLGGRPSAFFGTFVVMKLAADVIGLWTGRRSDSTPSTPLPGWASRILAQAHPNRDHEAEWREHLAREQALHAEDEQEFLPTKSTSADYS